MTRVPQTTRQILNTIDQLQVLQVTLRKRLRAQSAGESLKIRKVSLDVAQLIDQLDQLAGKATINTGSTVEEVKAKLKAESQKRRSGQLQAAEPCDPEQQDVAKSSGADMEGVMVALYPDPQLAADLAVEGGEAPSRLHITVIYFEDKAADRDDWGRVEEIVKDIASISDPFNGTVAGTGRFVCDDGEVAFAEVALPGLEEFHDTLASALTEAGFPVSTKFPYHPHITLKYAEPDEPFPPTSAKVESSPLNISSIRVVRGDKEAAVFPLGRGV